MNSSNDSRSYRLASRANLIDDLNKEIGQLKIKISLAEKELPPVGGPKFIDKWNEINNLRSKVAIAKKKKSNLMKGKPINGHGYKEVIAKKDLS